MKNLKPDNKKRRSAFTIVEIMIASAILIILMSGVFSFYARVKGLGFSVGAKAQLNAEARKAITQLLRDLQETNSSSVTVDNVFDPLDSQFKDILIFASRRGSSGESGFGSSNEVVWRSVIVVYPFVTSSGMSQLRKYTDYSHDYDADNIFPLAVSVVSDNTINLVLQDSSTLSIPRSEGEVLCNYLTGQGAEFTLSNGLLGIKLSLGNEVFSQGLITQAIENSIKLRN